MGSGQQMLTVKSETGLEAGHELSSSGRYILSTGPGSYSCLLLAVKNLKSFSPHPLGCVKFILRLPERLIALAVNYNHLSI